MSDLRQALEAVMAGVDLDADAADSVMRTLAHGEVEPAVAGAFLAALRTKGETEAEIEGFARAMRALATRPAIPSEGPPLVDTCGTGGDGSGSLNLSTAAALVCAAAGLRVVKHGNRSISSRCGSADVLEQLGVPTTLGPDAVASCLAQTGFAFLFAPLFHPAMGQIMPIRRAMGVRTVFNILGPLCNPAMPPHQVVGAYDLGLAEKMAGALAGLGLKRAFVVHGALGWDEATPVGPFHRFDVRPGVVQHQVIDPADLGVKRCTPEALKGGDVAENAAALEAVLQGQAGAHMDAVCLSAGLALEVCGVATDLGHGLVLARTALEAGRGAALLARLRALKVAA